MLHIVLKRIHLWCTRNIIIIELSIVGGALVKTVPYFFFSLNLMRQRNHFLFWVKCDKKFLKWVRMVPWSHSMLWWLFMKGKLYRHPPLVVWLICIGTLCISKLALEVPVLLILCMRPPTLILRADANYKNKN